MTEGLLTFFQYMLELVYLISYGKGGFYVLTGLSSGWKYGSKTILSGFGNGIKLLLLSVAAAGLFLTGCSGESDAASDISGRIVINEVMSVNSYYLPAEDGSCYDWIEFRNLSDEAVNLKDCMLSDNARTANKWKIPSDFVIEPDGYGIIFLSGLDTVDGQGNIHTAFKLSSKGESLIFSDSAGNVIQQLEIPECTMPNISYGLPDHTDNPEEYLWFAEPTPGSANAGNTARSPDQLVFPESGLLINEYMTKNTYVIYDSSSRYTDWIELYNSSDADVSLRGYSVSDTEDGDGRWFFPSDAVIGAGQYLLIFCSTEGTSDTKELHADFSLKTGDVITLYSVSGVVVDSVKTVELNANVSCGRDPQSGQFRLFASPTPGRVNSTYSYELTTPVMPSPTAPVYVNEVMCVSANGGAYPRDFVEIYNSSAQEVSLKGYGLAKNDAGAVFKFPDISISAGGYRVVYCTGTNSSKAGKTLTASFKLEQGGEKIFFYDPEGHVIDMMDSGKQTYGHSSGRGGKDGGGVRLFDTPTPGKKNSSSVYKGYAQPPVFSSEGGYVSEEFRLEMTVPEGCRVYYTTDGSRPDSSSKPYTGPVTISRNTVVSAVSYRDGYLPGQCVTATFLFEKKHAIPVVSVISDPDGLFSDKTGILSSHKNGLVKGEPNYMSDEEREITFEYYTDGKRTVSFNGRTRVFGEFSRKEPQKALAVLMSERYGPNEVCFPFFGSNSVSVFSSLVLRPSGQDWKMAHMRDELCSRLIRGTMSCDYMECQPVALYINGKYWGLYYLREKLNEDYLVHKYGMTKGKIDIVKWERIRQAGSRDGYLALCDYCETHDLTVKKHYDYVCSQIDIDSLMDWWIFETYVANDDTGNIRCYRDQNDGKWHWMLFDLDYAFSLVNYDRNYIKRFMLGPYHGQAQCNNSIPRNLLRNKDFREKFIIRYFHHIKTTFDPDRMIKVMDALSGEIKDEMPRQEERWGKPTVSYWNYNKKVIKDIIKKKPEIARQQIKEAFRLSEKQVQKYYDMA